MTTISPTEELSLLRKKRVALELAARVAAAIEELHQGLKAAQVMGNPTARMPPQIMARLEELEEQIKISPSSKLKETLKKLEASAKEQFIIILKIVEMDEKKLAASLSTSNKKDPIKAVLGSYLKNAQTAMALKALLRSRGEITKPTEFILPTDELRSKISQISEKEQHCREVVRKELVVIIDETERILQRDDLPEQMREMLLETQQGFKNNLAHLEAGKSITTLPEFIEVVEMDSRNNISLPEEATTSEPSLEETEAEIGANNKTSRPGFLYKLWRWITTPLNVGWSDIEREINRKHGKKQPQDKRR